jgi:ATP-dependent helicase/nuclease subunit A
MDEICAQEADGQWIDKYAWQYPHEEAVLLPLKLTASGISREITGPAQPPELIPRPSFLSEDGQMTGAERGTATHAALQGLDLAALRGLDETSLHREVVLQLNRIAESGLLTRAQREAVRPMTLVRFLMGSLGQRMLNAGTIQREWMFTLRMGTEEAIGIPSNESLLVQGAVDCCFEEDGQWILLDYKTDRVFQKDGEEVLIRRYKTQLDLYARALEAAVGMPVKEKLIYSFTLNKLIVLE